MNVEATASPSDDGASTSLGTRVVSGWISLNGALLAVCAFLPVVRTCDDQAFVPIEIPVFTGPNLYGAITAIVFGAVVFSGGLRRRLGTAYVVVGALTVVYLGVFVQSFAFDVVRSWAWSISCVVAWWALAVAHLSALRPSRPALWRAGRSTWTIAGMCVLFYQWHLLDALLGLWLALGASASLLVGGVVLELRSREVGR